MDGKWLGSGWGSLIGNGESGDDGGKWIMDGGTGWVMGSDWDMLGRQVGSGESLALGKLVGSVCIET